MHQRTDQPARRHMNTIRVRANTSGSYGECKLPPSARVRPLRSDLRVSSGEREEASRSPRPLVRGGGEQEEGSQGGARMQDRVPAMVDRCVILEIA